MVRDTEMAWLAGLIDGEGSVGITLSAQGVLTPQLQIAMTCERTIQAALDIVTRLGLQGARYVYQQRDPRHQCVHHLHVARMVDVHRLVVAVQPYSVTKQGQITAVAEFTASRLECRGIDAQGRIRRGGRTRAYTERERALHGHLRGLNRRGA